MPLLLPSILLKCGAHRLRDALAASIYRAHHALTLMWAREEGTTHTTNTYVYIQWHVFGKVKESIVICMASMACRHCCCHLHCRARARLHARSLARLLPIMYNSSRQRSTTNMPQHTYWLKSYVYFMKTGAKSRRITDTHKHIHKYWQEYAVWIWMDVFRFFAPILFFFCRSLFCSVALARSLAPLAMLMLRCWCRCWCLYDPITHICHAFVSCTKSAFAQTIVCVRMCSFVWMCVRVKACKSNVQEHDAREIEDQRKWIQMVSTGNRFTTFPRNNYR